MYFASDRSGDWDIWRKPAGRDWLGLAPLVVLAAVPARAWVPQEATLDARFLAAAVGAIALCALATETWFRGVAHGVLLLDSKVQHVAGPWHVSRAAIVSTALYALITLGASAMWILASPAPIVSLAESRSRSSGRITRDMFNGATRPSAVSSGGTISRFWGPRPSTSCP